METAKKPEIKCVAATVHVQTESELIRKLNEALPELTRRINENRRKARLSKLDMKYYHFLKKSERNNF